MHGHDHYLSQNDPANDDGNAANVDCKCGRTEWEVEYDGQSATPVGEPKVCRSCGETAGRAARRWHFMNVDRGI